MKLEGFGFSELINTFKVWNTANMLVAFKEKYAFWSGETCLRVFPFVVCAAYLHPSG